MELESEEDNNSRKRDRESMMNFKIDAPKNNNKNPIK